MLGVDPFGLDGDLKVGLGVDGLVDLSEGTLVDLTDHLEVLPHLLEHLRHMK